MTKFKFKNPKGISVLFLVIAMMLMITIGYVFSYLIPTKQKSVIFPIQSTQAFYIAQSGVEYAVRYAVAHNWRTTANLSGLNAAGVYQKDLGAGRFTISYTPDVLTSVGEVPSGTVNEKRRIAVTNFTTFMQQHLVLDTGTAPCLTITNRGGGYYRYEVTFYMDDIDPNGTGHITLNAFRANWDTTPVTVNRVQFQTNTVFTSPPNYGNGDAQAPFDTTHTIQEGQTHRVRIRFADVIGGTYNFNNLMVYFYDTNGNEYTFALDPDGNGLPAC